MKKCLILGGKTIGTGEIIKYLKSLGIYVIVTDYLPIESSFGKQMADEVWDISTSEVLVLADLCKQNHIDSVFTGVHEFNIRKAQELCEILDLPFYATKKQLERTSIKHYYKQLFRDFGISVPAEYIVSDDLNFDEEAIRFPVITKPTNGSGGRGIHISHNIEQLREACCLAQSVSLGDRILIEEYLTGEEVTIFYIIQNGKIMLNAMADREMKQIGYNTPLPVGYMFPSKYLEGYIATTNTKVIDAFASLGLKNGMVFIQAFAKSNGEFVFYDIGFRLTGSQEYHILEKVCGYNPLKMMTDYALTGKMGSFDISHLVNPYFPGKHALNRTYIAKPCQISRFIGLETVQRMDGVIAVIKNHFEGEIIPETAVGTLNQIVLRVLGVTNSEDETKELISDIDNVIDVLDSQGQSVLLNFCSGA